MAYARKPILRYKEYIKSPLWEERKRVYYLTHEKACKICGSLQVELHHLVYEDYGNEKDKYLAPLCREHHEAVHAYVPLRKEMFYQTERFIDSEREKYMSSAHTKALSVLDDEPDDTSGNYDDLLEKMARPIWRLIDKLLGK